MDVAEISRFAIKALIAAAIGVIACFIVVARVDDALDNRARQAIAAMQSSVHGGSNFWAKIEADLEKLADPKNDLPPEKRKKLLTQIKTLADRWRPLVVEALSVVDAGRHN